MLLRISFVWWALFVEEQSLYVIKIKMLLYSIARYIVKHIQMQSQILINFLLPLNFGMMLPLFIWGLFFYSMKEFCARNLPRQNGFLICLAWPYKVDCKTVRELSTENHEASAPTNFSFACQASHPSRLLLLQTFLHIIIENYSRVIFFTCIKISCFSSFCVHALRHKGNCNKCHISERKRSPIPASAVK